MSFRVGDRVRWRFSVYGGLGTVVEVCSSVHYRVRLDHPWWPYSACDNADCADFTITALSDPQDFDPVADALSRMGAG